MRLLLAVIGASHPATTGSAHTEDAANVDTGLAIHLDDVDPVAHQTASRHLATKFVHRGHRCVRRERPRNRRASKQLDERTTPHSITSSARASSVGGTLMPSILAVGALMTSSNFDSCKTGRSSGLAPLRMRPV